MELIEIATIKEELLNDYMSAQITTLKDEIADVFLIPKTGKIFSLVSYYQPNKSIFSTDFVSAFLSHYEAAGQSDSYVIFAAKSRASEISALLKSRAENFPDFSVMIF